MSVKEERAKVIEELNLDTRDPHTNLMAQAMALREALAAAEAEIAMLKALHSDTLTAQLTHMKDAETANAENARLREALRELVGVLEIAAVMPDAINKRLFIEWDDPILQRARDCLASKPW